VVEGTHDMIVEAYGYDTVELTVDIVAQEETTQDVSLATSELSTLSGVVTSGGDPLADASVELAGTPLDPVLTADTGSFDVEVAHGTYELRVRAHGHLPASETVTIDGDTSVAIELALLDQPSVPGWSEYQNNPARTGLTDEDLAPETFDELWSADLGGRVTFSSPVITDDRVFITTEDGRLHALDADTGDTLWTFATGGTQRATPSVSGDRVYITGGDDADLHALDVADGDVVWTYDLGDETPTYATPTEVDGTVYVSTGFGAGNGGFVHAVDAASGDRLWRSEVGPQIFFGPAVAAGAVIAASREDNRIAAFDADTGDELWSHDHDETFISMPAIADGVVYTGTSTNDFNSGSVLALDAATGDVVWHTTGHGDSQGNSPVVYGDLVMLGSHSHGTVTAYDRHSGDPAWRHVVGAPATSAQLVTAGGALLGGSQDGRVWALDASTGDLLWDTEMDDNVLSAPAADDDVAVFADRSGRISAFVTTGTIAGTVTGPDGPLEAEVTIAETDTTVTTDPDTGGFELAHRPGDYTLEVHAYGFAQHRQPIEVVTGRTASVDITLDAVGDGSLQGTVVDADGAPLADAEVTLHGTPHEPAITDGDGDYVFPEVAAGTYTITADADGYAPEDVEVTIEAGQTTVADFTLVRFDLAVVADYEGMVTDALRDAGWLVDRVSFDEIDGTVDRYAAVVLAGMNGDRADADLERFERIVDQADETGTSLVVLDQWAPSYGSLRTLSNVTGDPSAVPAENRNRGPVWLEDVADHPITSSLPDDDRVRLLSGGDHAWFESYTGHVLARLGTDQDGQIGGGIGYQRRTLTSNHVLLPVHAPTPWSNPAATWEPTMFALLADAVGHAVDADYGAVTGTVTDADDQPVAATITTLDGIERTIAGDDGSYELLLEPGDHTLRFRALGAEPTEIDVTVVAGETLELDVSLADSGLGTLTGQVTDEASGSSVADATLRLLDTDLPEATTDEDGNYELDGIPGGTYDVEVEADGYLPTVIEDVEVVDGEVATLDVTLASAPNVAVVGDRNDEITDFLLEHSIPAEPTGWEVTEDLSDVDVAILHNPPNITDRDEFLAHLDAFDEAQVSVVFPADGWSTRTRGIDLLVRHTGNPPDFGRLGGFSGDEIFLHDVADHPIFAGIDTDPVQLLTAASEAAYFPEYDGIALADVAEGDDDPAGIGVAYDPRTDDSVHVLLSGLASTLRNSPDDNWTEDGGRIFLNAVRWAAEPQLSRITGTVTDPDSEPIPEAHVEVVDTHWEVTSDGDGHFALGVPAGDHTLRISAFGYVSQELEVSVGPGGSVDASVELELAEVGTITGTVTSSGDGVDPGDVIPLSALEGVEVTLRGTPLSTVTDADGSFTLERVEAGEHELELETDGHVRTIADVEVLAGETNERDVELRVSPEVGVIDDSTFSNSVDRAKLFLGDWGYLAEDVDWDDLERIAELDLVVANISDFSGQDPGPEGFAAFEDVVNRQGIPVLWLGQHNRGGIEILQTHTGEPTELGQGFNDGTVTATVVEDHPLVAGLPDGFELTEEDRRYTWFDGYGGTTVATLATGDDGHLGDTIAYDGRTAGTVDVLLSTLTSTTWGAPGTRELDALFYTPEAERVYVNALAWALEADGIGAEVRGHVQDEAGGRIPSTIEVLETGRTFTGREGDGTFVVPLRPGTWTLEVSSFAFETTTYEVTVEAGEVDRPTITLAAGPAGDIEGTVTDAGGAPIEDATVRVLDTDRVGQTGADGGYQLSTIPEGDWTVEARADGYQVERVDLSVEDGVTHTLDLTLEESNAIAIAGDRFTTLEDFLTDEGYEVDSFAYNAIDDITPEIGSYRLVILNGVGTAPSQDSFLALLDAAADADVSIIFGSQFNNGSIRHLSPHTGDPEDVTQGFRSEEIAYTVLESHPVFAGFDVGDTVTILRNPGQNQQFSYFSGYSGETLARLDAPVVDEQLGDGVAYRFASAQSVHLLLGSLAASLYGSPPDDRWTEDAKTIYRNAVAWAIEASQGEVVGTVTSDGEPLEDATVTAVEAEISARTGADGSYQLGLPAGEHTLEATADGYEPETRTVTVGEEGAVEVDFDLTRLPRGELEVLVTDSEDDAPGEGAQVTLTGPMDRDDVTDGDGSVRFEDLVEGDYALATTATGYLDEQVEITVTADEITVVEVALSPNDVAVLGDVDEALTQVLRDADVAAEERGWDELADELGPYRVVVVNGGTPDEEEFEALLDGADEAGASLIFTGTWGVDRGGIRLLESFTDDVTVGGQGFGDGEVGLSGFDPDHALFDGLDDPSRIVADDGYYSWLDDYVGHHLGDLTVDGEDAGLAIGYDFRGVEHVHLLLSITAVSDVMGPGYGWTDDTERLLTNAVAWVREVEQEVPDAPTLSSDADEIGTEATVTVSGEAEFRSTVTIVRGDDELGEVAPERDGSYELEVELVEGENVLEAVATNHAGSTASEPLTLWLDTTGPVLEWTPEDGEGFLEDTITVAGTAQDEPAGVASVEVNGAQVAVDDDGAWSTQVTIDEDGTELTVVATDTLGNVTVETRTVAFVPLEAEFEVPPQPSRAINVRLHVTDLDGTPTQVDGAEVDAIAEDGTVDGPHDMRWSEDRYQAVLRRLPSGDHDLVARLAVDEWTVTVPGPTVTVR
jgi:outer membrane protein assembly factor BamB